MTMKEAQNERFREKESRRFYGGEAFLHQTAQKKNAKNQNTSVVTKKMEHEQEQEQEKQPTTTTTGTTSPHSDPAFALKMLVDSRNAGAVLGTR